MNLFNVYRSYPFPIPLRVKFFNLFRFLFRSPRLEKFLLHRLNRKYNYWRKLIPPLYFYDEGSFRDAERNGIRYRLDISKQLEHSIYFYAIRDIAWDNLLRNLREGSIIIDVGANIGYLTLQFAVNAKAGMVHAFEPDTESFCKLSHNIAINRLEDVHVYQTALGSRSGTGNLFSLYRNNPGANRILPGEQVAALSSEKVEIATLDSFADKGCFEKGVNLIKIDVEGYELFVLQGSVTLIERFRPVLFVELVDQNLELQGCSGHSVVEFVSKLGYDIFDAKTMEPLIHCDRYNTDILCYPTGGNITSGHE